MERITNTLNSIILSVFPTNRNRNSNYYYCTSSVSIFIVLSFLQLINLNSHFVDSFPSAISKQSESYLTLNSNNAGRTSSSSSSSSAAESLIDRIDVDSYLKNHRALKLQIQCIVYEGPCDFLGKWLKPRIRTALLGECTNCSEKSKTQIAKIVDYIQTTFPEEFKLGVTKYLLSVGLEVPEISTTTANNNSTIINETTTIAAIMTDKQNSNSTVI